MQAPRPRPREPSGRGPGAGRGYHLDSDREEWFGAQVVGFEKGEWVMLRYESLDPLPSQLLDEDTVRRRKLDHLDGKERRQLDKWILTLERNVKVDEIMAEMNKIGPRLRPATERLNSN